MAREMWGLRVVALVLGLLVMAPETMQLFVDHPMHGVVQRLNNNDGPFIALILSSTRDERTLMRSGYFEADQANPKVMVAGRMFRVGKFRGAPAIVARAESPLANVGATAQALLDTFKIGGFIHYGAAGAISDKLNIGDVSVPESVAFSGVWQWQEYQGMPVSDEEELPSLRFGDYNLPRAGENSLASIQQQRVTLYTPSGSNQKAFWIPVNRNWLNIATTINGIMMKKCTNGTVSSCVNVPSDLVHGVKAVSSDIFVENAAYANYLYGKLGASTVDTDSAAVVAIATANGVPCLVFRGASNKPGMKVDVQLKNVVANNILSAVSAFVDEITRQPRSSYY